MKNEKLNLLVLGANGLIGFGLYSTLNLRQNLTVYGTIRSPQSLACFPLLLRKNLFKDIDVDSSESIINLIDEIKPDVIINCIGLTKHIPEGSNPLFAIPVNSFLPHYLAAHSSARGIRLIHISSDCVFSGSRGGYLESDTPDAFDIYGRSKMLGEVDSKGAITLRTSTIGHELSSSYGLLNWFLGQKEQCNGFSRAFFSGVTTVELARIIADFVLPVPHLAGLYHVVGQTISKYDLLMLIAAEYHKTIKIIPDDSFAINRSLNGEKFKIATGYTPSAWPELIEAMYKNHRADIHYV